MGKLSRCISADGSVVILALDSADIVETARRYHHTSKVCTAALGRLLTGASMMGFMLKNEENSVTLRVNGSGRTGAVIAVADAHGNARGYVMEPNVEIPPKAPGKLDVGGAGGKDGTLTLIKDLGAAEPTVGQIPLVSGEIAEDLTAYFASSEQIPTACALGVLVNPDGSVACAGGYLIQLLPAADEAVIDMIERSIRQLPPVTTMLSQGTTPHALCERILPELELQELDHGDPVYRCTCSRERAEKALISAGKDALREMAADPVTELTCHFCPSVFRFTSEEILALLRKG